MNAAARPLASVMSYLRANMNCGRGAVRIGPFLATFDADSANRYRNYAVPEDGAEPTAAELAALVAGFAQRGRQPRLEYVPDIAPGVLPGISAAGFAAEGVLPLMVCTRATLRMPAPPQGFEFLLLRTDGDDLDSAACVQNRAYGETAATPADVARLRALLVRGGTVALARQRLSGAAIGSGLYSSPQECVTEIAAVGVLEEFRGRGIASQVTASLAQAALARGLQPFLMAASEREACLYQRLGFVVCGTMLHICRPL
jgi:GNAT superfamily N-acetyltransferase